MTDEPDPERWERTKAIFADALERDGVERADFVARATAGDAPLAAEVASLLEAHEHAGPLMAAPTLGPDDWDALPHRPPPVLPERLGRFLIRSLLGTGGMGEVYLAHDPMLDRSVALKVLPADLAEHPQRRARFLQEARTAASLNHPHITTIHEIGEADGRDYIAFEYVEGRTLRERVAGRPLDLKDLVDIAVPLADALAHAHERGLVHRDIKTANVMVSARGSPKLLDFGLAKLVGESPRAARHADAAAGAGAGDGHDTDGTSGTNPRPGTPRSTAAPTLSGSISGTPEAMSPEQALGQPLDQRTDVFSFGSLLHEMASGRAAFVGRGADDTLKAVIHAQPPSLRALRPDLPDEFIHIVERALRKPPDERYQSFADLAADLRALQRATDTGLFAVPATGTTTLAAAPLGRETHAGTRGAGASTATGTATGAATGEAGGAADGDGARTRASTASPRAARLLRTAATTLVGAGIVWALLLWSQRWTTGAAATVPVSALPLPLSAASPPLTAGTSRDGGASPPATDAAPAPRQIAVLTFENTADPADPGELGAMLGRLLTTHLSSGAGLVLMSQQRLYEVARELGREDGRIDRSNASAVAKQAGVDAMILGRVGHAGEALIATAEVVEVPSGLTLGSPQARGETEADVFAMAASLGRQVRDTLREPALSDAERRALDEQLTTSVEAFRAYVRGIEALQRNHASDAVQSLQQATAIDPAFALAHFRLAMALVWTGRFEEIAPAIARATAFSEHLPRNIRLLLTAARPYFDGDDSRTGLPALLKVIEDDPHDADALYFLGEIYTHSTTRNDARKAAEMFERLLLLDRSLSLVYEHLLSALLRLGRFAEARARVEGWRALAPDTIAELEGTLALWDGRMTDAAALLRDRLVPDVLSEPLDLAAGDATEPASVRAVLALGVTQIVESLKDVKGVYLSLSLDLRADILALHGRFAEAAELYRFAAEVPGAHSLDGFLTSVRATSRQRIAFQKALLGDVAGARSDVQATLDIQPDSYRCLFIAGLLALRDHDETVAQQNVTKLQELASQGFSPTASLYRDALASELQLARGQSASARSHLLALVSSGRLMEDWYAFEDSIGPLVRDALARACLACDDPEGAARAWDGLLGSGLERLRQPLAFTLALHARGVLALEAGDVVTGRALLERFLHGWGEDTADADVRSLPEVRDARARLAALAAH